jgi:hypothetical protein
MTATVISAKLIVCCQDAVLHLQLNLEAGASVQLATERSQ